MFSCIVSLLIHKFLKRLGKLPPVPKLSKERHPTMTKCPDANEQPRDCQPESSSGVVPPLSFDLDYACVEDKLSDLFLSDIDCECPTPMSEEQRAVAILAQCASLYKSKLRSEILAKRIELLKDISELYHIPPALIYHAATYGPRHAHSNYKNPEACSGN